MGTEEEQALSITIHFANAMATHDTLPGHVVRPFARIKFFDERKFACCGNSLQLGIDHFVELVFVIVTGEKGRSIVAEDSGVSSSNQRQT